VNDRLSKNILRPVGSLHSRRRVSKSKPFASSTTSQLKKAHSRGRKTAFCTVLGDNPPTGRSVEVDYIQVLRFRDGKHVSLNLMFDRLTMLEQLGLVPTSAAAA
jgi:ketosteroid isomerase-like protein